ncbi:alpha-galactosidase [Cohnella caldifontis]|uniref:alpha-galactosidase n=1 Tax=Cohnella caldifontis TaxID=3027471 RepID=UPI0023EBBEB8|nr:alpha-galactosidase [Cohnella sp. YIM B05605]
MSIRFIEGEQRWVLQTEDMDYVIGIDAWGRLEHEYWGPRLASQADYAALAEVKPFRSFEDVRGMSREEIMPWHRLLHADPGLKLTFGDGTRDLVLAYDGHSVQGGELRIEMVDRLKQVRVRLNYRVQEKYDLLERWVELVNESEEEVRVERMMGAIWHLPERGNYRLTHLTGHWGAEMQLRQNGLSEGKTVLEERRGLTGHQSNPWFAVDFGDADETSGEVYFGAVAYSGHWSIMAEKSPYGFLQVGAGYSSFDFAWTLAPGESLVSPVCIGGYTRGGFGQMSRMLHDYQRERVSDRGAEALPVLYNSWEAAYFDVDERSQMELADIAAKIGIELFVMDDGWFAGRNGDKAGLGDWTPDPVKFPNGLAPLIDHVHGLGMRFGLWVEPEMTNADSDLYRKHPDWVYHYPDRERTESRNQMVLNLARSDVREFVFDSVDRLLCEYDIDYIKWDMNRYISEPGWPGQPAERQKEIWLRHVNTLYEIWRRLRAKHPRVSFESCAGGGGRVDLGIMRYSDQFWITDNTDPYDRLFQQEGYSYAYTTKQMRAWVTESPHGLNRRSASLKYRFHSAMAGALGIGLNLRHAGDEELEECRQWIERYKALRPVIQEGDLYRLLSPRAGDVSAVQYTAKDRGVAVVFLYLHAQRFSRPCPLVRLQGLEPAARYRCEQTGAVRSGSAWMAAGLRPELRGDYDSAMFTLAREENA